MEFNQTKTFANLTAAFAGECQAGMRYQIIARTALAQGYKTLSDEIKQIAKNETYHAETIFNTILNNGASCDNATISAGYPFEGEGIEEGLSAAAKAEKSESEKIYPAFAKTAEEEGFDDIADLFLKIAEVEKRHETIFEYLYERFKNGALFLSDEPIEYECTNCGYGFTAKQAYSVCPLCKSGQGFVRLQLPKSANEKNGN